MIRKLETKDLPIVADLWLNTNITAHAFVPKQYWIENYDHVKHLLSQSEVYVFEQNHEILAFLGLVDDYIAGIFVKEGVQSKGIGNQLIAYAKHNKQKLRLNVYQKNKKAIQFYLKEGFQIQEETIDSATQENEYLMQWNA